MKFYSSLISFFIIATSLYIFVFMDFEKKEQAEIFEVKMTFLSFDYNLLESNSDIIVVAKVLDNANENNLSLTTQNENIVEFYSLREVKVIDVIKGEIPNDFYIVDYYGFDGGIIYTYEGYKGLIKDKFYVMYLRKADIGENQYFPLSSSNGLIQLDDISTYHYEDIGIKSILGFTQNDTLLKDNQQDISFVLVNGDVSEFIISESIYVRYTDSWLDIGQSNEKSYVFYNGNYYWMNFNGGVDNE